MDNINAVKTGPKDVFLHFLSIVTLYASAISFCVLVFQYINLAFPEVIRDAYYYKEGILSAIRGAVSTLIVVFPVYFITRRFLRKSYEEVPERRNMAIGKWLGYLTLFIAAVIGIGWLVWTINRFLEGDFTTAFLLKALVIFFTTGSIFFYYLSGIKGKDGSAGVKYYAYFASLVVLAAIVGAFFAVGSPTTRRLEKEDQQRLNDLRNIQMQIGSYYQNKEKIPAKLSDLNDAFRDINIPKDPVPDKEYTYAVKGPLTFELCADFALPWTPEMTGGKGGGMVSPSYPAYDMYYGQFGDNWKHDAGHSCFERTIDKDYFKNIKGIPL